eukprot:scaffold6789_cov115-Isochrysis_galbana.AAC.1
MLMLKYSRALRSRSILPRLSAPPGPPGPVRKEASTWCDTVGVTQYNKCATKAHSVQRRASSEDGHLEV